MDPVTAVGLAATVCQLIAVVSTVVGYLNNLKEAVKDRGKLAREVTSLLATLTDLRYRIEDTNDSDPWFVGLRSLGVEHGPLDQFKEAMEELAERLKPATGLNKIAGRLKWPVDQKKIKDVLSKVERLKSSVMLAQQKDQ
jgi:hypothetical protein